MKERKTMKGWKTIVLVGVIVLLVVALILVAQRAFEDKDLRATKKRLKVYRVIEEDLRLTLDIIKYRTELAKIQAAQTRTQTPVVAPPTPVLPPETID